MHITAILSGLLSRLKHHPAGRNPSNLAAALLLALAGIIPGTAPAVAAMDIIPFQSSNQSPLIRIFGLPEIGSATVISRGRFEGTLTADVSNNFAPGISQGEVLMLDGETYRFNLTARYGIAPGVQIGIDIPYLANGGGFLDGFIEGFHDTFGLPQGMRKSYPRNRLRYQYSRNGITKLLVNDGSSGLGDIRLSSAWQLYHDGSDAPLAVALHGSIKLPSGNSNRLFGSGSTDFALWLTASDDFRLPLGHLTLYGAAGGMTMTDGNVLEDQQRNLVGFGSLGIGWSPLSWLALKIQADAHTSFYTGSSLEQVNSGSVQLISGGTIGFTDDTFLDIGVAEDVLVDTAPDVVFHFALRSHF
ncbi:MAG: DUF3187 family protein [Geobacteraceae bacterium]|nr:DUF3187 family protein [Geobacteraceae bacterium]